MTSSISHKIQKTRRQSQKQATCLKTIKQKHRGSITRNMMMNTTRVTNMIAKRTLQRTAVTNNGKIVVVRTLAAAFCNHSTLIIAPDQQKYMDVSSERHASTADAAARFEDVDTLPTMSSFKNKPTYRLQSTNATSLGELTTEEEAAARFDDVDTFPTIPPTIASEHLFEIIREEHQKEEQFLSNILKRLTTLSKNGENDHIQ
jgi:hypothetical protein